MKTWKVYWSPEGRCIAIVEAKDIATAKRKAPKPYRKYLGEIYVVEVSPCGKPITDGSNVLCGQNCSGLRSTTKRLHCANRAKTKTFYNPYRVQAHA